MSIIRGSTVYDFLLLSAYCYPPDGKETVYEVLFDEEFLGGLTLRCSPSRAYCLPPSCLLNLSHGVRLKAEKNATTQDGVAVGGQNFTPQRGSYSGVVMSGSPSVYGRDYPDGHAPVHHRHGHYQHNGPVSRLSNLLHRKTFL